MNLKQIGKVFTSKSVGTGPSSFGKKNLPGRDLTEVGKEWPTATAGPRGLIPRNQAGLPVIRNCLMPIGLNIKVNFALK